jgi:hypothetical protein
MASNSETGHVTNVTNLGKLNAELTAMGPLYNPSNPLIMLPALVAKQAAAELKMKAVTDTTTPYKNAVNIRDENYEKMDKLAIKIKNALAGSGAKADIIKDVTGIVNKIIGKRTGPKPELGPEKCKPAEF